jgi:hypothetical protein
MPNGAWEKVSDLFEHEVSIGGLRVVQFSAPVVACLWLGISIDEVRPILYDLRDQARSAASP